MEENMKTFVKLSLVFTVFAVAVLLSGILVTQAAGGPQGGRPGGMMGGRGSQNSLVTVAADVLGMQQADLVSSLQSGKTIADVAKEKGVTLDKIVDAFVAARQEFWKTAVANGRMTQAQVDSMTTVMRTNILARLSESFTPRGPGFMDADHDGQCDNCGMMNGRGIHQQFGPAWNR
jgi:hypothetical protein